MERQRLNLRVKDGASGIGFTRFDPFASTFALAGLDVPDRAPGHDFAATPGQVRALVDYGVPEDEAAGYSHSQAAAMKKWCYHRDKSQQAGVGAYREMLRRGLDPGTAAAMKWWEAREFLARTGGRRRQG
jgi:hypothetical protein